MNTMTTALSRISRRPSLPETNQPFRRPNYDCRDLPEELRLVIYVPGTTATAVEIEARGPDLTVTARKQHFLRSNWQTLHLESAQKDYRLKLRLGHGLAYADMNAAFSDGILRLTIPKRPRPSTAIPRCRASEGPLCALCLCGKSRLG
jgi:HSP20 family molecular chaperone IbpA